MSNEANVLQGKEACALRVSLSKMNSSRAWRRHAPNWCHRHAPKASTRTRTSSRRLVIVVLATNVIVASLVAKGLCHEVVVRCLTSCTAVTSAPLLEELDRTLRARYTIGPAANAFLEQLRVRVRLVEPVPLASPVSRDAYDDVVLATAAATEAAAIVTGDQDLLVIGRYHGIDIVSPRDFLNRLSS